MELLETRQMLAVGADGWTISDTAADTKTIYVSSSGGSDANSGLSASAAVKTLGKASSLMRSGYPDWMLLKTGDTFGEVLNSWGKSGRNGSAAMRIATYGTGARPILKTGAANGITLKAGVHDLEIVGIRFTASKRDPNAKEYVGKGGGTYGFQALGNDNNILIENCQFDHYVQNVVATAYGGACNNIKIRRNVIVDSYSKSGSSDGIYASGVNGLWIEGNVVDHNGWNEFNGSVATTFNHNIYITADNKEVTVRDNVISQASSHGLQARSGGNIENNLFLYNPIGMSFGLVNGSTVKAGGVTGHVTGNVYLGSRTINGSLRGTALEISNTSKSGWTIVAGNIFAHDNVQNSAAIMLAVGSNNTNGTKAVGVNNLLIRDNISYHWEKGFSTYESLVPGGSGPTGYNNVYVANNDFQHSWSRHVVQHWNAFKASVEHWSGNSYNNSSSSKEWFLLSGKATSFDGWMSVVDKYAVGATPSYVDPLRTIESYAAQLGLGSSAANFIIQARLQSKGYWRSPFSTGAAIDFIRGGFADAAAFAGGANLSSALNVWR